MSEVTTTGGGESVVGLQRSPYADDAPRSPRGAEIAAVGLRKQIKSGGDFAKLAKDNSEDPGSGANGGNLGDWITHGQMVPEFDKAIFSLKPGQTSLLRFRTGESSV